MSKTIILANGSFPVHEIPVAYLKNAERVICCDGSSVNYIKTGRIPDAIVGDLDTLPEDIASEYNDRIYQNKEQESNDLSKAVKWCTERGYRDIVILGATGKREDHTIGNISLLTEYAKEANVIMVTDTGIFLPYMKSCTISSFPGQQVSVFSIDPDTEITSQRLKYELRNLKLHNWWRATLNEAMDDTFELTFDGGPIIVYLKFRD